MAGAALELETFRYRAYFGPHQEKYLKLERHEASAFVILQTNIIWAYSNMSKLN